jgi:diguanylate cyclase (GGDEF)-like protein/PAS domain S-box-containing protein
MSDGAEQEALRDPGDRAYLDVVLATADGLLVVDPHGVVLFANPAAERVLRRTHEELERLPFGLPLVGGDQLAELDVVLPGGHLLVLEMHASPIRWQGHDAQVVTLRDVTDRVVAQRRLEASEDRYALSAAAVNDGLWHWERRTGRVHASARLLDMLGLSPQAEDQDPEWWLGRVHLEDVDELRRAVVEHVAGRVPRLVQEVRLLHHDGSWLWTLVRGLLVRDGDRVVRFAGSVTDISVRRSAEEALRRLALHDPLTGLANRALILDHLQGAIDRHERASGPGFAVVFLDLDQFKLVNDSLGHPAGDALLVEVARRLEHCVRATDTVGRLGGDEFVVLLEAPADTPTVLRTVQRIRDTLSLPITVGAETLTTTASMGVLLGDDVAGDPEAALRNADIAMYEAKVHGRDGFQVFTARMHAQSASRLTLRTKLSRAAARGELFARYQPVVDLDDGRVLGFEALLRWRTERGRVLDAEAFIDAAEETGVIVAAGWELLSTACHQVAAWRRAGFEVSVAVNLAEGQVTAPDLPERVAAALSEAGVDGSALQLELTERIAMTRVDQAVARLDACRRLGVEVLVDDFGTGYSSLTTLHELPLTALKIDKSFVSRLGGDVDAIVAAVLALARSLGLGVVAEGIETVEQRRLLRALGCHVGQGYLYGVALDPHEATRLLETQVLRERVL